MRRVACMALAALLAVVAACGGGRAAPGHTRAQGAATATATAASCKTQKATVRVRLSASRYPHITDHIHDARGDYPARLHIDRPGADENRDQSLAGVPLWSDLTEAKRKKLDRKHWQDPHDRDEYPPAVSKEGGTGADVRYVIAKENRSSGSVMGSRLAPFCNGQAFRLVVVH